jgi:serine protease Do
VAKVLPITLLLLASTTALAESGPARAVGWSVVIEGDGIYGSGVLLAPSRGAVVTCLHVVEEMKRPRVSFADGTSAEATVIDRDRALDLALLRVPPQKNRQAPTIGDPHDPGEEVFAVGCPRHLAFTLSRGIVSYVGRILDGVRYLQTDLPMNEGNSGGPVVNARGELYGLMAFVYRDAQGLSFAVPARAAVERFRRWL